MTTLETTKTRFDADGFVLIDRPVVPADLVARAVEGMDMIRRGQNDTGREPTGGCWKPGDAPDRLCKVEQPQRASKAIFDLVSHPALGQAAAEATGAATVPGGMVQVWWVQLLYKPAATGEQSVTRVGWHRDRSYWGEWEPGSEIFTTWIALSDVREDCGPMMFIRGSHRWPQEVKSDFFGQDLESQRRGIAMPEGAAWEEVAAILPPGGISIHDDLTIHGSGLNHSGRPRRSLAIHMRTQASRPIGDKREGLTTYLEDPLTCPVIYGKR
ncbi:MAG: phytanoyl-CoA dioxygenase family protein [Planctomycetota bacterium]|nr:phytanoyl-CoA dioxygenase family protein [Planctomycetota bacterium]